MEGIRTRQDKRAIYLICVLLVLLTAAVFHPVLGHDFVNFDDDKYVTANEHVKAGLTADSVKWALTAVYEGTWQPLVWLSYMLDRQLFGMKAAGYHFTSLFIHVLNVLLLFLVLYRMTGSEWKSAFAAALFAIHPQHVEPVAWVASRKDVLSTLFWFLTVWAYLRYVRVHSTVRYAPVVLLFVLGLMAKPMLVTLPFTLLLLDYWPLRRLQQDGHNARWRVSARKLLLEKWPLFLVAVTWSGIAFQAQKAGGAIASLERVSFGVRLANGVHGAATYLVKTFCPIKLGIPYPHAMNTLPTWQVIGSVVLVALITAGVLALGKHRRYLVMGWFWYVGTLVPVLGLVQFGAQSMADRFTYVPLIGVFIMLAWGIPDLFRDRTSNIQRPASNIEPGNLQPSTLNPQPSAQPSAIPRYALTTLALISIASLSLIAYRQVGYWKNSITLFSHTIRVTGPNAIAHANLATALVDKERLDEAIEHYQTALRIAPGMADIHHNLANALYMKDRLDEAIEHYSAALSIKPDFADALNNLQVAMARKEQIKRSGSARPAPPPSPRRQRAMQHFSQGVAYDQAGRIDEAIREYREAVRLDPKLAEAHVNLAVNLRQQGIQDEAIRELREAIRLKPDFVEAHHNLAVSLYLKGDYAGAWKEIHLVRQYGGTPIADFVRALSEKLPDPWE